MNYMVKKMVLMLLVGFLYGLPSRVIAGKFNLWDTIAEGNVSAVGQWLDEGGDPNTVVTVGDVNRGLFDMPAAGAAIFHDNASLLRLLLNMDADPNGIWSKKDSTETGTLLEYAVTRGRAEAAKILVDHGVDPVPLMQKRWYTHPFEFPLLNQRGASRLVDHLVQRYQTRLQALGELITPDPARLVLTY